MGFYWLLGPPWGRFCTGNCNQVFFHDPFISHTIWLVVDLPLWKMMEFVSWDDDIPNCFWKVIQNSMVPVTTNQQLIYPFKNGVDLPYKSPFSHIFPWFWNHHKFSHVHFVVATVNDQLFATAQANAPWSMRLPCLEAKKLQPGGSCYGKTEIDRKGGSLEMMVKWWWNHHLHIIYISIPSNTCVCPIAWGNRK